MGLDGVTKEEYLRQRRKNHGILLASIYRDLFMRMPFPLPMVCFHPRISRKMVVFTELHCQITVWLGAVLCTPVFLGGKK